MSDNDRFRQMAIRSSVSFPGKSGRSEYSDEWYTPPHLVAALGQFDLDPAAGPMQHAARNIRYPDGNGLTEEWVGRVWLNPPYSNVHAWLSKFMVHGNGIALVNARPETKWFQRLVSKADACHWLRGRIEFHIPEGTTKHPVVGSVLVAYGAHNAAALLSSGLPGVVMTIHATIEAKNGHAPGRIKSPARTAP